MSLIYELKQQHERQIACLQMDYNDRLYQLENDFHLQLAMVARDVGLPAHGSTHSSNGTDIIYTNAIATVKPSARRRCSYCGQANHDESLACEFCGGRLE